MSIINLEVEVLDPIGLHARPASQIAKLAKESELEVLIGREGEKSVKADSALMMMTLKVKSGERLKVSITTDDHSRALEVVTKIQEFLKG